MKGARTISLYSNQFKNASKNLARAEADELLKKKKFEKAHSITTNCEYEYVTQGLLYYNNEKRFLLLQEAENLCYSKVAISRLRNFTVDNWNKDSVTIEDIREMQTIEEFVRDHTPAWKKSPFSQLGEFINKSE